MSEQPCEILPGMSVRGTRGLGAIVSVRDWRAIVNFSDEIVSVPTARLRANPNPNITGALVVDALRVYKTLFLRKERGEELTAQEEEAFAAAKHALKIAEPALDAHSEHLRAVRAAQPKVSSEAAHAQARRVLSAHRDQGMEENE